MDEEDHIERIDSEQLEPFEVLTSLPILIRPPPCSKGTWSPTAHTPVFEVAVTERAIT